MFGVKIIEKPEEIIPIVSRIKPLLVRCTETISNPDTVIENSISGLTCKHYEYSVLVSSCEHFAKLISRYTFDSNQTGDVSKLLNLLLSLMQFDRQLILVC